MMMKHSLQSSFLTSLMMMILMMTMNPQFLWLTLGQELEEWYVTNICFLTSMIQLLYNVILVKFYNFEIS